jgi:hypothetical protein
VRAHFFLSRASKSKSKQMFFASFSRVCSVLTRNRVFIEKKNFNIKKYFKRTKEVFPDHHRLGSQQSSSNFSLHSDRWSKHVTVLQVVQKEEDSETFCACELQFHFHYCQLLNGHTVGCISPPPEFPEILFFPFSFCIGL